MNQANLSSIKWLPVIAISATIVFMFSPMVAGAAGINSTTPQITVTHITGSPPFQRDVTHQQTLNNTNAARLTFKGKPPFSRPQKKPDTLENSQFSDIETMQFTVADKAVVKRTPKGFRPPFKRN